MEKLNLDPKKTSPDEEMTAVRAETPGKAKRRKGRALWIALFLAAVLAVGCGFLAGFGRVLPFFPTAATMENGWNLILVNDRYLVPDDYVGELVTLANGQQVDRRIYPALQQMFDDMRNQGVYPVVASGYRTEDKQKSLLSERIREYRNDGCSWFESYELARNWVARPGTSEHQLGIAVDINQEGTKSTAIQVYEWLAENAHLYGFINRYPKHKEAITGISSEPWHYRFVGAEAATEMYTSGLCLEEYLGIN